MGYFVPQFNVLPFFRSEWDTWRTEYILTLFFLQVKCL